MIMKIARRPFDAGQIFAMQKHSKIRNVPFPRPCGATGNDAQKLHAPAFAHFRGAVLMHEVLYEFLIKRLKAFY